MPQFENCYIIIISATLAEETMNPETIGANGATIKSPFGEMSKYIEELIQEYSPPVQVAPHIKGLGDCAPRHITQELLSQNKYLQKLLETIFQGILDTGKHRVLNANQSATIILQNRREVLLGSFLNEILEIKLWETLGPRISTCQNASISENKNQPVKTHDRHVIK